MSRKIFILVITLAILCCRQGFSQENYFEPYNKKMSEFWHEKIYLHTDRNTYSVKEDIWFKIYLLDGTNHTPLAGGNTVYIDLAGPRGEILIHKPFYVENGTGDGNFTIGDTLKTGVYTIYAYTNYLRNFDVGSFFKKHITISQIILNTEEQLKPEEESVAEENQYATRNEIPRNGVSLQFMPEGGYLSDGMQNSLAFKIATSVGKGINLRGAIKNGSGQFIDSLNSSHLGMGKIDFRPQPGQVYHAVLDGFPSDTFPLPPSCPRPQLKYTGIADSTVHFILSDLSASSGEKIYYLAVKTKGMLSFYVKITLYNPKTTIRIDLNNFIAGLNQAVLLDSNYVPLAERLFYIPGSQPADMNIQLSAETFKTREKTEVRLDLLNSEDISAGGSFSMAAINLDQIGTSNLPLDNIVSYLELNSEIMGPVEDPGYYFSHPYDSVKDELDLLLLTQGWTKYIWDEQYLASLPEFTFPKESGLTIAGHAKRLTLNSALEDGNIILFIPEEFTLLETTTDSNGYYHFDNLILYDSTRIFVQSRNKNNRKNTRLIDANCMINPPHIFPAPEYLNTGIADLEAYNKNAYPRYVSNSYFDFDKSTILIEEVSVVRERETEDDGHFRMYAQADNVVDVDDYSSMGYSDLFLFLQGSVPGLRISGDNISIRGARASPLILLDGFEIDIETARTISLQDVDKIEVLKNASSTGIFGVRGGNGVIAIYTKGGEIVYRDTQLFDIIARSIEGYAKAKEFYMPDYDNPGPNLAEIDHRATVFWSPKLTPDSTGTCIVSFFNSDDTGNIAIVVEGLLSNGKPGIAKTYYRVERD